MSYQSQFGTEYNIPEIITAHPGIIDISWGNDMCPSFTLTRYQYAHNNPHAILWVEHPNPDMREQRESHRYMVCTGNELTEIIYEGDDAQAAISALERGGLCKGDVVRFHTPLDDESPEHRYTLIDDPAEAMARAESLRKEGFPEYRAQVSIQLVCNLTFKPISTVPLSDIVKA